MKPEELPTTLVDISTIELNPDNPRTIDTEAFDKLVRSLKKSPWMLQLRPIVVDENNVVLGGNMRLRACRSAGYTEVPVIVAKDLTKEQQSEFIIKDNVSAGEWNWEQLANEWDAFALEEWGLEIPKITDEDGVKDNDDLLEGKFIVDVSCRTEQEQAQLFDELTDRGFECKLIG